jgi:hypothetical protein
MERVFFFISLHSTMSRYISAFFLGYVLAKGLMSMVMEVLPPSDYEPRFHSIKIYTPTQEEEEVLKEENESNLQ